MNADMDNFQGSEEKKEKEMPEGPALVQELGNRLSLVDASSRLRQFTAFSLSMLMFTGLELSPHSVHWH